jgi:hypothetical protein
MRYDRIFLWTVAVVRLSCLSSTRRQLRGRECMKLREAKAAEENLMMITSSEHAAFPGNLILCFL